MRRYAPWFILLFVAYLFLLFYGIDYPVWNKDEGLYADTVREMIERGNYLDPYFNYEHRWQKPILIYWVLLPFATFFDPSGWSLRLGLIVIGLLTLVVSYLLAKKLFKNSEIAFFSAFFLLSSVAFLIQSRHIVTHLLLLFTIMLAFYFMWDLLSGRRERWRILLFGAALGLVFLAKLYVGMVFVLTTGFLLGIWEIWQHKLSFLKGLIWGIFAFSVVALPWYIYMIFQYGDQYTVYVYHEFFDRITQSVTGKNGPFFYIGVYFGNYAPWSIPLVGMGVVALWRHKSNLWRSLTQNMPLLFALTGFFVVFFTLSIPKSKLPGYLFSLQGFAAILTAYGFYHLDWSRWIKWLFYALQTVLSLATVIIWIRYFDPKSLKFALIVAAILGSFLWPMTDKYRAVLRLGVVNFLLLFSIAGQLQKEIAPYFPYERYGKTIVKLNETKCLPVYSYNSRRESMPFYAQTKINPVSKLPSGVNEYILLIDEQDFNRVKQNLSYYKIVDRSLYYKGSDSQVFKIINMQKGYRPPKDEGVWLLVLVGRRNQEVLSNP
ncbi:glycosyltransferase family 39 protein [Sulfurovum sp.]|uniref:ArnT family glycosyltransferase n=1 Tax=Sulfurovum sp. TaxID=1969726 RepID=UPI0025EC8210|nr:glycosyltransferase family 39 protein [Sulfurovum sp.]